MQRIFDMIPSFKLVNFEKNYDVFLRFRKCAHLELKGSFDISEDTLQNYIKKNIEIFGEEAFIHMFIKNEIIGQIEMSIKEDKGYVCFFYVDTQYRSKGYFKFMHAKMMNIMKHKKIDSVILSTPFSNKDTIKIYEKYGWKFFGQDKRKGKEGMILFKLLLQS